MSETRAPSRSIGYARVSTTGQTLQAQLDELGAAGCGAIFREKQSGAKTDRKELARLVASIQPGDVVTVTRIDRMARSVFDLFAIVSQIVAKGGTFRSLAQPWADTSDSTGRLMLAVLSGLADVERDLIKARTMDGRARAKARGVKMGRRPKLTPAQQAEVRERLANGEQLTTLARSYNVSANTIGRIRQKA